MNVHFMSQKTEWETPQLLFDLLDREFGFTLDPCASHNNRKCEKYYTKDDDGLVQSWGGEVSFVNPPFGRGEIEKWLKKAYEQNSVVVCLVPCRTDSKWWHSYCMKADEIRFLDRRLEFVGSGNKAPFPVAIVIFRNRTNENPRISAYKTKDL